jgi:hypothetical protein
MRQRRHPTQIGTTIKEEGKMSIINKLTGLYTHEDVDEVLKFSKREVKRLREELFLVRLMLSKAHMRDPKTGRLLKRGIIPKKPKDQKNI